MSDGVTIKVDTTNAIAKFDRLTPAIRNRLRTQLPVLANQLAAAVDRNLGQLKSRNRLKTVRELHESANQLYARVAVEWTGADTSPYSIPQIMESGRGPVEPITAKALKIELPGGEIIFRKRAKAFAGIFYMRDAFASMRDQIVAGIKAAAKQGAGEAKS